MAKTKKQRSDLERREKSAQIRRTSGEPTTAGTGPGGGPTGLRHSEGWPNPPQEGFSAKLGGAEPTGAVGGSGTSAGGLAEGQAGIGGARNMPHGAGRPATGTSDSEMFDTDGAASPMDLEEARRPSSATTKGTANTGRRA